MERRLPAGIADGVRLERGVHEHWNGATRKQYSRNLGTGAGIELVEVSGGAPCFTRGDANGDTEIDIGDPVTILLYRYVGGQLSCLDAADADDDGRIEAADAIRLLGYLFLDGDAPLAPLPSCGVDETADELTCD